jgi:2,3-bisphosphoglycerate-independent phosphoglycerate mutase
VLPSFPQHAVSVRYATEHRCGVVVRGAGLCDAISGTDPLKDNLPLLLCEGTDGTAEVGGPAAAAAAARPSPPPLPPPIKGAGRRG